MLGVGYDYFHDAPYKDILLQLPNEGEERDGNEEGLRKAWAVVCERSKLVRCARGMMREYCQAELEIVEVGIIQAYDKHGVRSMFDLNLVFGHI